MIKNDDEISTFFNKKNKKILFLIISKSGDTIETLSNTFTLNILKKKFQKHTIIISEKKKIIIFIICLKNLIFSLLSIKII